MKIEFEISDPKLLSSGLSHALASYGSVVSSAFFGCEIPEKFEDYFQKYNINGFDERYEHLKKRWHAIKDILDQLDKTITPAVIKAESEE